MRSPILPRHDLTYESAQSSRTFVRELFLMQEARDRVRREHYGAYLYEPVRLTFGLRRRAPADD